MQHQIICNPTYSAVEVSLQSGERIVGDSGAMAWMTANIKTETSTRGGFLAGMKRKLLSGESFFQNTYCAEGGPGAITLAPGAAGDIHAYELAGDELFLEKGAYLASDEGITCDSKWGRPAGLLERRHVRIASHRHGHCFFSRLRPHHTNRRRGPEPRRVNDRGFLGPFRFTNTFVSVFVPVVLSTSREAGTIIASCKADMSRDTIQLDNRGSEYRRAGSHRQDLTIHGRNACGHGNIGKDIRVTLQGAPAKCGPAGFAA